MGGAASILNKVLRQPARTCTLPNFDCRYSYLASSPFFLAPIKFPVRVRFVRARFSADRVCCVRPRVQTPQPSSTSLMQSRH